MLKYEHTFYLSRHNFVSVFSNGKIKHKCYESLFHNAVSHDAKVSRHLTLLGIDLILGPSVNIVPHLPKLILSNLPFKDS